MLFKREPALWLGALGAATALATAFGLDLSAGQVGAISAAATAVLALVTRSQVRPVATDAPPPPEPTRWHPSGPRSPEQPLG